MIDYIGLLGIFKKNPGYFGKKTGFIKRQDILTALDFLLVMTVGQLGMKHPSLAAMVDAYQMEVNMGTDKKTRICSRLICFRVKEEVANQRRMRLKREAKKKGRIQGAQSLLLADWTIIVTNVPEKWIPSEMLWRIYSIRFNF